MHGPDTWIDALEARRLMSHGGAHEHNEGAPAHNHSVHGPSHAVHVPMDTKGVIHLVAPSGNAVIRITRDAAHPSILDASINGTFTSLGDIASIKGIEVKAGAGNDDIEIVELNGAIAIPVTLLGGAGNDTLVGGSGNDLLDAGQGNNVLSGQAGDDTLVGGPGTDTLLGGSGHNTVLESTGVYTVPLDGGSETPGTVTIVHAPAQGEDQSDSSTPPSKHHKKEPKHAHAQKAKPHGSGPA